MDRMVTMAAAQSQKLEQDSFEGVDDDEWVCRPPEKNGPFSDGSTSCHDA
jgi:hypothetical protein